MSQSTEAQCPFSYASGGGTSNRDWWPNQLPIDLLAQHSSKSNPMDADFEYKKEFQSLDYAALKADLAAVMTASQPWWRRTSVTMGRSSFAWRGTARARTAWVTGAVVAGADSSAMRRSTAGPTT